MNLKMILLLSVFAINLSYSQENHEFSEKIKNKNCLGLFVGNTTIVQSSFHLPTVGVEYFRELNHNFGVGIIAEFEIGSHIVQKDDDGEVVSEAERKSAVLILPTACIRVYKGLIFKVGYGVELEEQHNLGLLKVGFEYVLFMKDPDWRILPSISWDHTKYFDGVVYGITFGYVF